MDPVSMVDRELHQASQESFMKIVTLVCRVLLGLIFVVFGANILHPFLPMPPMPPDAPATHLMNVMGPSGWMTFIGAVQFVGGLLVLIGGTTPLGLVFLGPVLVNILLFHLRLNGGQGIGMGVFATVLEVTLIYAYRGNFAGIFTYKATPTA